MRRTKVLAASRAARATLLCLIVLSSCRDATRPPAGIVLSRETLELWVGDTVRLTASAPDGTPLRATWSSNSPSILVSSDGAVTAIRRGVATLRAEAQGVAAEVEAVAHPVVAGLAHAPDGTSFEGLVAVWVTPAASDSGVLSQNGSFRIRVRPGADTGDLIIDAPEPRQVHPFLFPTHVDSLSAVNVVLVPNRWRIRRGMYAGTELPIGLDSALEERQPVAHTLYFAQPHPFPNGTTYQMRIATFADEQLPLTVVFDHQFSGRPITGADSSTVWEWLDGFELAYGRDLFAPGTAAQGWWTRLLPHEPRAGVVRILIQPESGIAGRAVFQGDTNRVLERPFGSWHGGRFTDVRIVDVRLTGGAVWLESFAPWYIPPLDISIPARVVFAHEVLHVLGFGHTRRLQSLMMPLRDVTSHLPTPADVAYMEVVQEVVRLEREHNTFLGLLPSLLGHRQRELGLLPLPQLPPPPGGALPDTIAM